MYISVRLKPKLVAQFGGKCQECGYSRCLRALQFHHLDPTTRKDWMVNGTASGHVSAKEILAHPENFLLLCANCHIEEHDRIDQEKKLYVRCLFCDKEFVSPAYLVKTGRNKYCSRECQFADRPNIARRGVIKRFWKHVKKTDTCWFWTGTRHGSYGQMNHIKDDGKYAPILVHRFSYILHHGPIPERTRIAQSCDNDLCIHPEHLVAMPRYP